MSEEKKAEEKQEIKKESPEAPKAEAPKVEAPKQEAAPASAAPQEPAKKEEKKTEAPAAKKEKPSNCASCNKSIKKKRWYYRNGRYYCTKECWRAAAKKEKAPKEEAAPTK